MSAPTSESASQFWNIDSTHSSVSFSVKHMGVFTVRGSLGDVTGTVESSDGQLISVDLKIDASGITTNNDQRDGHLKSADFLNVEQYPVFTFKSTSISRKSGDEYSVTGDLTITGKTHSATFDLDVVPPVKDPWGNSRSGATGSGVIRRSEFGITYNSVIETGHMLISDEVKFTFDIQGVAA